MACHRLHLVGSLCHQHHISMLIYSIKSEVLSKTSQVTRSSIWQLSPHTIPSSCNSSSSNSNNTLMQHRVTFRLRSRSSTEIQTPPQWTCLTTITSTVFPTSKHSNNLLLFRCLCLQCTMIRVLCRRLIAGRAMTFRKPKEGPKAHPRTTTILIITVYFWARVLIAVQQC